MARNKSLDSFVTAAIYARVSTDDGRQNVTNQVQAVKGGGKIYQCGGAKVSHLAAGF